MKIFFTGSVRSGRENQPQFEYIVQELRKHGTVYWQHIAFETLPQHGETSLSSKDILKREKQEINNSDIVIAEVSSASLWVWYLLAYASSQGKKIIALHNNTSELSLSAIIKWDQNIEVLQYLDKDDFLAQCAHFFTNLDKYLWTKK